MNSVTTILRMLPPGCQTTDRFSALRKRSRSGHDAWTVTDLPGSETQDDTASMPELVADRYRLLRRLGQGSSKVVYLAQDQVLPRQVALALVPGADLAPGRFTDEVRLMAQLGMHPNVVTIHDIGEAAGTPFIVTPYFEGGSLDEHLAAAPDGRLEIADAVRITAEVASGLAHAHAAGIVHRDVKPSNVWLTREGRAALGDFGIARSVEHPQDTAEGMLVGTALYVSPEQAIGAEVDARSDLYSLGVTLYELVCGERPFTGSNAAEIVQRHRYDTPPPPSRLNVRVPPVLEHLILRLLSKRPGDRPESAEAVRAALLSTMELPPAPAHTTAGFIGRTEEIARGRDALAGALAGSGRLVAITGEPGIGKTRIARELAAEAEAAGAAVLSFACPEETGAPAYWPWRQLLRTLETVIRRPPPLPPEVAALIGGREPPTEPEEPTDPEAARFRTFEAIIGVFEAASTRRALVLIHEDLQWADPLSIRLLCHLARRVSSMRVLLVATYRDGAVGPGDPLREVADVVSDSHHLGLDLRGLEEPEIGEFIERTAGVQSPRLARELARHTGGNPFFVAEIVRMLRSEDRLQDADLGATLPARVRQVVGRRLDRLSPDVRRTLDAAAVQGTEFELDVLAATAEVSRMAVYDALETARATHLVRPASGRPRTWRFAHGIIRDAVAADVPESRQALLHAGVGRALERHPRDGRLDDVEELALHFVAAAELGDEEAERAVRYSRLAGEAASRLHAYPQAARHYERALAVLELRATAGARERFDLLLALADAVTAQGDAAAGRTIYLRAAAEARTLDDPVAFAEAAVGHSEWQEYGESAYDLLEETLERLPADDSALRATVLGHHASRLPPSRQAERERLIADGIAMARRLDDQDVLAVLLARSLFVHWGAERREARRVRSEETLALASGGVGRPGVSALWAHVVRCLDAFAVGRMADAHAELAEFELLGQRVGRPFYAWYAVMIKATLGTFTGGLGEAERLADEAFALISRLESDSGQEHAVQRLALARMRGLPEQAPVAVLRDYAERYATLPVWLAMVAGLEADLGRTGAARRALDAAMGTGPRGLAPDEDWLSRLFLLAEACAAVGDARHAERLHELLAPYAEVNVITERGWAAWGAAARSLGKLAATCGEPAQATAWFERALALHRAWGAEPLVAHTILDHAVAVSTETALIPVALEISTRLGLEGLVPRLRVLG
jgi:tRNA A-37 threonylcarbamoyl transferase component Bud32